MSARIRQSVKEFLDPIHPGFGFGILVLEIALGDFIKLTQQFFLAGSQADRGFHHNPTQRSPCT